MTRHRAPHRHAAEPRLSRFFHARRVGDARGHLAGLAAQPHRLAGQARHHPLGLWRDRAQDRSRRDGPHAGPLRSRRPKPPRAIWSARAPARPAVEFIVHPTNRGWTRDSGPVFVRRCAGRKLETAIVHFHFNAWAKYADWQKDRRVPETAARHLGKRLFDAQPADARSSSKAAASRSTAAARCSPPRSATSTPRSRCATPAWAATSSRPPCATTWASPTSSGWPAARRATTPTATSTTSAVSSTPGPWC